MRETIIFAPGANGAELLRSLARFGVNTLGYRVFGAVDLARAALQRRGIAITKTFLPRKDEPTVIDSFLREIDYFENASYADAESMAGALYTLRSLIAADEAAVIRSKLPEGEFPKKNRAILEVYERYIRELAAKSRIDTVGLVREALANAETLDADILTLKEYPLSPLEQTLAGCLSAGEVREISLTDLFRVKEKELHDIAFTECYGASNEVRDIISYIYKNKIPLDHCTVAVAETLQYAELFNDLAAEHEIPVTFGCGLPITVSDPARVLKLYQVWNTSGFRGIDALSALIMSSAFDRKALAEVISPGRPVSRSDWKAIIEAAGSLRLSADGDDNRKKLERYSSLVHSAVYKRDKDRQQALFVLSCLPPLSHELEKGAAHLVSSYAKIRDGRAGRADRSAVTVITGLITAWQQYSGREDISQIIPAILNKTVSSESSREGCLHVCGISGALAVPREYLFVAGLSASDFPGSPTENYLLLDSDLLLFGTEGKVPASDVRILRKKQSFMDLLREASALDLEVRLSYSSYDLADLKDDNPSSVLQEVFHQIYPEKTEDDAFRNACRHVSFFEDRISRHSFVGAAYVRGDSILPEAVSASGSDMPADGNGQPAGLTDLSWSPSSIDIFFNCPKRFYLTRVLGIEEQEPDDPFEVIDAKETGTMAHSLMEMLGKEHPSKEDFRKAAGEAFDRFLYGRPLMHEDDGEKEKKAFVRMMENAWEQDPKRKALHSEKREEITHQPSGVRLQGIIDRVEEMGDGKCLIIDFKTGRSITHQQDDIGTCLQVLVYAYMMEQEGLDVAGCEYRYLRRKQTVPCRYDAEMKDKLNARLSEFRDALSAGDFPCKPSDDACRFCRLGGICGKDRKAGEEGDGDE